MKRTIHDMQNWFGGAVKVLVACLAVALAGAVSADVETKNDVEWTYSHDGTYATIVSIPKDTAGAVYIPPALGPGGSYTVAHIGAEAFKDCTLITSAFIPSTVESVGTSTFEGCTALESAAITGSMTVLPERMFKGCTSLKSIDLGVYSLVSIEANAFGGCTALESIVLPEDELTTIGSGAFSGCSALKEVTMKSVKMASIAINAFSGSGLKTVYVAEGQTAAVTAAGLAPSAGGFVIKEISDVKTWIDTATTIEWSYRTIGDDAEIFNGGMSSPAIDASHVGPVVVPPMIDGHTVTLIGEGAFDGCYNLTGVTLPATVTSIGAYAFNGCTDLESVNIPDGVTSIGAYAFNGCIDLESVNIPDGVTSIGESAFYFCSGMTDLTLGKGLTVIGDNAFANCSLLKNAAIPDSVTSLGEYAFFYCSGMTDLTLGKGLTSIGSYAFSGCHGLTDIPIPDGVTSIGDSAFSYCSNLESVSIPDSVTSIGIETFMGCLKLANATIGGGITSIPDNMFSDCALTSVEIPYGATSIGDNAFKGCASLASVAIPDSVTSIGASAFEDCVSLADATIPSGVTSIGSCAFKNCALTCVEIPRDVTIIGYQTFYGCAALEIVTIAQLSGITTIGSEAFSGCASLAYIELPDGVMDVQDSAFKDCSALMCVAILSSGTTIGTDAFAGTALDTVIVDSVSAKTVVDTALLTSGFDTSGITTWIYKDATPAHTVSFYGNGGTCAVSSKTVYHGFAVGALPPATRAGYAFLGWFTDFEGGSEITETTIVNDDTTCFAHWLADGCARETVGGIEWTYRVVGGEAEICNGEDPAIPTSTSGPVAIPEKLGLGYWVTAIGTNAFNSCSAIKSVTIPDGVTTIRDGAFFDCATLTEVNIPASVAEIGNDAFNGCSALADLSMQEGVTSIGECAFNNCTALTEATIPATVTMIGDDAFSGCVNLASLTMQDGVLSIGERAFSGCSCLEEVVVPDSVTNIGEQAFAYCGNLKKATVPIAFKGALDSSVFQDCHADLVIVYHGVFTVTFDANGGTVTETSRKVDSLSPSIGELPTPTRMGYDFDGWYTAASGGTKVYDSQDVEGDATFYAHWTPKTVYILFDANYGEGGDGGYMQFGDPLVPPEVTREGYVFSGWTPTVPSTVPAVDTTYTAQWTEIVCTVVFVLNLDGASLAEASRNVSYGDPVGELPTPTSVDHTFVGWFTAAEGGAPITDATIVKVDELLCYAHWTENGSGEGEGGGDEPGPAPGPGPEPGPGPTPGPEPEPDIHVLNESAISGVVPATAASEYNGYIYNAQNVMVGTFQLKVGKANAKTRLAAVKATVQIGSSKKMLKGSEKGKSLIAAAGPTTIWLTGGEACAVLVGSEGLSGSYGAYYIDGARNFFISKDKSEQNAANAILAKWLGPVNVVAKGGTITVKIAKKGKAKAKGTLVSGKVSAKAVFLVGEKWCCVPVLAPKAGLAFNLWLSLDGTKAEAAEVIGATVGKAGTLLAGAVFQVDPEAELWTRIPGTVLTKYLPNGVAVTQNGKKWVLPKAGKISMKNGIVDESKMGDNPAALKLTYKAADGTFKGSFKVFASDGSRLKATTVNVTGVVIDGIAHGTATVKGKGETEATIGPVK